MTTPPSRHRPTDARVRLPDFILAHTESILAEWETFARSIWPPGAAADPAELRDHAEDILRAAVEDMRTDQTPSEQSAKSHGHGDETTPHSQVLDTASHEHGAGRVESGFKLAEVIAEYRALRASVVRLWRQSCPRPHDTDLDDLTRFHESIDQSLAHAVASFTDRVDQSRRLFLAILGHDLRNPLAAMKMMADMLARRGARAGDDELQRRAAQITASARDMDGMIADLLDFTAAGLGGGMPVSRAPADLDAICRAVVDQTRAAHDRCAFRYEPDGDTAGRWDAARLRQVVSNLLGNAAEHGAGDDGPCTVTVRLRGEPDRVVLTVHNTGRPIPPHALPSLFDPLRRVAEASRHRGDAPARAGLGLFIAHQVVTAHGGTIDATSTADDGTTFTIRLPRK